jgi:hypothetical protein
MTHTLHRMGNRDNLAGDFAVLAMSAKGINETGSHVAMRRFMELAFALDPVNAGDMKTGNMFTHTRQEILDAIQDVSIVHAVFTDEAKVAALLAEVREADLGLSVVVSGLFDRVCELSKAAGVRQHTVECSGGVWGRTERLPDTDVMQITTMCGHGMVAAQLVERVARQVRHDARRGRQTAKQAALELARPCVCGIFNPVRAAALLEALAAREAGTSKVTAEPTMVPV